MFLSISCAGKNMLTHGQWIDLTHEFSEQTIYWPTSPTFKKETVYEGNTEKGYYYSAYKFSTAEHGGTHIDSPIHFYEGRNTVDQIPVRQLIGPGAVIDVSKSALSDSDYQVTVTDILKWESANGKMPDGAILLLNTGYGQYWPDRIKYMGTDQLGQDAVKDLHFAGLHPDTAKWLVKNRKINAVGLDTPSIDYGQSSHFGSHVILFEANIPAFENVANLDKLPATGATIFALPMKIKGGSGGPLRIIAHY
ncbi:MAG: cyclase family protein [Candidatus Dadabacteria bacterium]|nr:cyclase family protein [Candidatus Dadabacteria bacterium]NIS08708.1 cyclase family protein [Candidatus Dadabacteria bacterium]NIV42190.1 cyclase family protein [Candidatus Dadabacteria bacterium]NIX15394.1 cyclase family protein [Candidatus Dadabacteria bacterium]NIY22057.1 cyclase family protein [Candidatus Dadabacteria bacterium]